MGPALATALAPTQGGLTGRRGGGNRVSPGSGGPGAPSPQRPAELGASRPGFWSCPGLCGTTSLGLSFPICSTKFRQ